MRSVVVDGGYRIVTDYLADAKLRPLTGLVLNLYNHRCVYCHAGRVCSEQFLSSFF